jgi:hypothetical protein
MLKNWPELNAGSLIIKLVTVKILKQGTNSLLYGSNTTFFFYRHYCIKCNIIPKDACRMVWQDIEEHCNSIFELLTFEMILLLGVTIERKERLIRTGSKAACTICWIKASFTQENYPWIGTDKNVFLCLVSSGLELMTLRQRKIFLSVPIHG